MPGSGTVGRAKRSEDAGPPISWRKLALLGCVLVVLGVAACLLPQQATVATSTGLGAILTIAGAVTLIQSMRIKSSVGFNWHMLAGAAEIVGGILIWLSPLKGAAAIALLLVVVLAVQGVTQLMTAVQLRGARGWIAFALSGLVCIAVAVALVVRFPYESVSEPGAMAGIALIAAGLAHLVLAAARYRAGEAVK